MPTIADNQAICMHRGDSLVYPIFVNVGSKALPMRYPMQEGDTLYVGIMEPNAPFECSLIRKALHKEDVNAEGDVVLRLGPKETECLLPGLYYYEAKLECERGGRTEVHTVVPRRRFVLVE